VRERPAALEENVMSSVSLDVNGRQYPANVELDSPLLYVLRDNLGLNNPRFGCGLGQCGACTVLVNNEAVRSCILPVSSAVGKKIVTLEGLGTPEHPHPVQQAFIDEQAVQCGFCLSGVILTAKAYLDRSPKATESDVRNAMSGVLCRCGANTRMLKAIGRYARGGKA